MSKDFNNRVLAAAQRVYGWLLRAYPPGHRKEYGPAMAQLFRDQCHDAWQESQGWGVIRLWLRVLPDLASTSVMERLAAMNERKTTAGKLASLIRFRLLSTGATFLAVFVAIFFLIFGASVIITSLLPESYASTARIKVESDQPAATAFPYDPYFIQTTFEIMQSQLVLSNVIAAMDLNEIWGKKYFNGETLKTTETMEILKDRMSLTPVRNTKMINITVYSDDKNEAAQIANAVAKSYRNYRDQSRADLAARGMAVWQGQYANEEAEIQQEKSLLAAQRQQSGTSPQVMEDKQRDLSQLLNAHKSLFAKIEAEKIDAQIPPISVQLVDPAVPGNAPVRPNKTLNIVLGGIYGVLWASGLGGLAAFITAKIHRRNQNRNAPA